MQKIMIINMAGLTRKWSKRSLRGEAEVEIQPEIVIEMEVLEDLEVLEDRILEDNEVIL